MNGTRRQFMAGLTAAAIAHAAPQDAPNIIVIMPDQWRGMDLGYMGNEQIRTPVLDRLAAESVVFRNTVANTPVCGPSRSTVLTGRYPHQCQVAANDMPLPRQEQTVAEVLSVNGYYTGFVGKWHLSGLPRMPGFVPPGPERQGFQYWAANVCNHNYVKQSYFRDDPAPIAIPGYDTPVWTDLAIEFLEKAKAKKQPFFLSLWYPAPHDPYLIPPGFEDMYQEDKIKLRPNWKPDSVRPDTRKDLRGYYSAISCIDQNVGRLLARLDALGMKDNTVVVFTSDHGDMHGSQGAVLKRKPWEESCLVPGIVRWPAKLKKARTSDAPFSLLDLTPTLLGLAGANGRPEMEGHDYSDYLLGRTEKTPEQSIMQIYTKSEQNEFHPWRGLRTRRWKYARFAHQPWVLYDLEKDPYEMKNLAGDSRHKALLAKFDSTIKDYMRSTGDDWTEKFDVLRRPGAARPPQA